MTVKRGANNRQLVFGKDEGDCLRAALSFVLGVPNGDHMPNPHHELWFQEWRDFFHQFGVQLNFGGPRDAIWRDFLWVASVPSKNLGPDVTHAIVVNSHRVEFDPSTKQRYRRGLNLLSTDLVLGGYWLELRDATLVHVLAAWLEKHQ